MKYIAALIFFVLSTNCFSYGDNNTPDFPFVHSTGSAELKVKPDIATVTFGLVAFSKDAKESVDTITLRGNEIVKLLKKHGISSDQITATAMEKNIRRNESSDGEPTEIIGYKASQEFTLKLSNLANYSLIANELVSLPNLQNLSTNFDISNRSEVENKLIKEASENAKLKANQMASSFGVKLGQIFAISKSGDFLKSATFGWSKDTSTVNEIVVAEDHNMFVPKYIEIENYINVIFKLEQ
jgi:uncharacterized protein YggE